MQIYVVCNDRIGTYILARTENIEKPTMKREVCSYALLQINTIPPGKIFLRFDIVKFISSKIDLSFDAGRIYYLIRRTIIRIYVIKFNKMQNTNLYNFYLFII